MSRKNKEMPAPTLLQFWENVLHYHNLGMNKGKRGWLSYGHTYQDTDSANEDDYSEESEL